MKILEVSRYKNNFSTHIVPFVSEQGESLRSLGNEVDYFLVEGKGILSYFNQRKALLRKIAKFKPDVIHAHFGLSGITAVLQNKVPVVTTFHNGETLNKYVNLLTSVFSLRAKHVIYVAQHIYDLVYCKHKHYTILPCGVNMEECVVTPYTEARKQLGWSNQKKYILFGGAFDNLRKNYPLLKQAIELIGRKDIEVIEMRGLNRQECTLRMCACDCFALPTHSEGSPQALKEAMACNCPIVATDTADIAHLLGDLAGHYLLRNPRKTKERWDADERSAGELAELLEKALAFNGRTEGRKRIEELGLTNEQVAKRLVDIYQKL